LYENDTNHGLKAVGGETLAPGAYAIIADNPAKFATDWPSYAGFVFDSAFALNNTGETLVLRCCGKELTDRDSVTYNSTGGGNGDGLSLHRSGSTITAAQPSPGTGTIQAPPPKPKEPEPTPTPEPAPAPKQKVEPVVQPQMTQETTQIETQIQQASPTEPPPAPTIVVQEEQEVPPPVKKSKKKVVVEEDIEEEFVEEEMVTLEEVKPMVAQVAAAPNATPTSSDWTWLLGAAGVSLLGAGGAYVAGRNTRKREWKIEEME
jgi:hypothetical protein